LSVGSTPSTIVGVGDLSPGGSSIGTGGIGGSGAIDGMTVGVTLDDAWRLDDRPPGVARAEGGTSFEPTIETLG
jgi:hypothetical protein